MKVMPLGGVSFDPCDAMLTNGNVWKKVLEDLLPTPPESPTGDTVLEPPETELGVKLGSKYARNNYCTDIKISPHWKSVELTTDNIKIHSQCAPKNFGGFSMHSNNVAETASKCPLVKDCMWSQPVVVPPSIIFAELSRRVRLCRTQSLAVRSDDIPGDWIGDNGGRVRNGSSTGTSSRCYSRQSFNGLVRISEKSEDGCITILSGKC